jgi:small-conductance mechanosensitive channel
MLSAGSISRIGTRCDRAALPKQIAFQTVQTNLFSLDRIPVPTQGSATSHVLIIIALALGAHFVVLAVRFISDWLIRRSAAKKMPVAFVTQQPKFITLTGLVASAVTFAVYFIAVALILREFKVDLTPILATASVIGLAVGFGSQGLVQDVVTGLTLIISDTLDVGDIIEVGGRVGRVEKVGLRFTELLNFMNQRVFVPNRNIADFARFPRAGVSVYADVQLPAGIDPAKAAEAVRRAADGLRAQFGSIVLGEPELSPVQSAGSWSFLRVHFRVWPGQNNLVETTFRQVAANALKSLDPNYADWMVTVTYRAQTQLLR